MYHFKSSIKDLEVQDSDLMGTLDIVGMFPNILVAKTLEVVSEELKNDTTLSG